MTTPKAQANERAYVAPTRKAYDEAVAYLHSFAHRSSGSNGTTTFYYNASGSEFARVNSRAKRIELSNKFDEEIIRDIRGILKI
jgi:hypothetical protein